MGTVFERAAAEAARRQGRTAADQLRERFPKLGASSGEAEYGEPASMSLAKVHLAQILSTNPVNRPNADSKRYTTIVDAFPNDTATTRLVGAMILGQNDDQGWCSKGAARPLAP